MVGRGATLRNAPGTTEELLTPSPRVERRRVVIAVVFAVLVLVATILTVLTKERMIVALLLETSKEVPKGSGVVHVVERSHDD